MIGLIKKAVSWVRTSGSWSSYESPPGFLTGLKVFMAAVVVTAGTVALLGFGTKGVLAVGLSSSDINIATHDGNITAVSIAPEGMITWENIDTGVTDINVNVFVSNDTGTWQEIYAASLDCSNPNADFACNSTKGSQQWTVVPVNITDSDEYFIDSSPPFSLSDFNASDGSSTLNTVHIKMEVRIDNDEGTIKSTTETTQFDVNVTNKVGNVSADFDLNANVSTPTG